MKIDNQPKISTHNHWILENDILFSEWHRHTPKKAIQVLLSGVEPKNFRLLVRMLYHWATGEYKVQRKLQKTLIERYLHQDKYYTLRNSASSSKLLMKIDYRPKISMHNHLFLNLVESFIFVKIIVEKGKPFFRKEQTKCLIVLSLNPKVWPFIWNMVLFISSKFLNAQFLLSHFLSQKIIFYTGFCICDCTVSWKGRLCCNCLAAKKETKLEHKLPYLLTCLSRIRVKATRCYPKLHAHPNYDPLCPHFNHSINAGLFATHTKYTDLPVFASKLHSF